MSPKSLRSVIRSLVITESLEVYTVTIYPLHPFDRKETFSLLLPSLNRPDNVRSRNGSRGAVVTPQQPREH